MSYRPDNQSIEGPATAIVAAIKAFEDAVEERAIDGDWKSSHLDEITDMAAELSSLKHKLRLLARENW